MNLDAYLRSLDIAAMQFKLALQVAAGAHGAGLSQRLVAFSYGRFSLGEEDLKLSFEDAAMASTSLQRVASCALAIATDTALERTIPDRFNSAHAEIVLAARIARILRNAFAHDPFFPRWSCTNPNHLGQFNVPNVISIDTSIVHGLDVEWQHYGGPLALLRFLGHCQGLIRDFAIPT
jgi:hypothetical protein